MKIEATPYFSEMMQYAYFAELEIALSLKQGFFETLLSEDDWSFVIKLHALVEAASAYLLTKALGDSRLEPFVSRIEMSNNRTGKLAIIKALDLVDSDSRRFIQKLSELRNRFVHDVSKAAATLDDYFESLDKNDAKECEKAFRWGIVGEKPFLPEIDNGFFHVNELTKSMAVMFFPHSKKFCLWFGSAIIFQQVYHQSEKKQIDQKIRDLGNMLIELVHADETHPSTGVPSNSNNKS